MTAGVRNLSRQIWINVAPPPTDLPPSHAKGKTPTSDLTPVQLRRRKIDALHLAIAFVYSVKHYLRGEDGLEWEDYVGIVPAWFLRFAKTTPGSYAATRDSSLGPGNDERWSARNSPEGTIKGDATKRIRVKRSKPQLGGATTPLLSESHRIVNFAEEELSMPLPLV